VRCNICDIDVYVSGPRGFGAVYALRESGGKAACCGC
jgi:hypothetical protein